MLLPFSPTSRCLSSRRGYASAGIPRSPQALSGSALYSPTEGLPYGHLNHCSPLRGKVGVLPSSTETLLFWLHSRKPHSKAFLTKEPAMCLCLLHWNPYHTRKTVQGSGNGDLLAQEWGVCHKLKSLSFFSRANLAKPNLSVVAPPTLPEELLVIGECKLRPLWSCFLLFTNSGIETFLLSWMDRQTCIYSYYKQILIFHK